MLTVANLLVSDLSHEIDNRCVVHLIWFSSENNSSMYFLLSIRHLLFPVNDVVLCIQQNIPVLHFLQTCHLLDLFVLFRSAEFFFQFLVSVHSFFIHFSLVSFYFTFAKQVQYFLRHSYLSFFSFILFQLGFRHGRLM